LSGGCRAKIAGIEIQEEYCAAAERNSRENGFSENFKVIQGDIKEIKKFVESGSCDVVFTNPPYLKTTSGKKNVSDQKNIAFHEVCCNIDDICKAASWCLKSGGKFYAVYRPERLTGLLASMRSNRIEPKRMRFVVPSYGKPPSLILIEGKKDAKEGIKIEADLCIYSDSKHSAYSSEMEKIYREFE
jgi:tRNA1Val (adenine37-N6)-methyltransferase